MSVSEPGRGTAACLGASGRMGSRCHLRKDFLVEDEDCFFRFVREGMIQEMCQ